MAIIKTEDERTALRMELKRRDGELMLYKEAFKDSFLDSGFSTKMWNFLDMLLQVLDADLGMAFLLNSDDSELALVAVKGLLAEELKVTKIPFGSGIAAAAVSAGEPQLIDRLSNDVELFDNNLDALLARSSMAVPIKFRGRVSGVIQLVGTGHMPGEKYVKEDLEYFASIVDEFSSVSEKSYAISDMKETIDGSTEFISASGKLISTLDARRVKEYAVLAIPGLVSAEAGELVFLDEEAEEFYFECAPGGEDSDVAGHEKIGVTEGVSGWVVRQRESIIINNVKEDGRFDVIADRISGFETKSIVCVPIFNGSNVQGVLQARNKKNGRFVLKDRRRLETFAEHVSSALNNAAIYNELKHKSGS